MTNATHPGVGAVLNQYEEFDSLPPGTVICETRNENRSWTKDAAGGWDGSASGSGGPYSPRDFSLGYNKVLTIPTNWTPPPKDNLMRYKWKFRNVALAGQIQNGVSRDAVLGALRELGVDESDFPMGPGIVLPYSVAAEFLPPLVVVSNLQDVKSPRFAMWVKEARRNFVPLLGTSGVSGNVRIEQYPGLTETPAWWIEEGTDLSDEQIAEFKIRAYQVGLRVKREQSWCGTYEHVIAGAGVSQRAIRELRERTVGRVGHAVTRPEAAQLPLGTVLLFRDPNIHDRWGVFVRVENAGNATGYLRHAGSAGSGKALGNVPPTGSIILTLPNTDGTPSWEIEVPAHELLAQLPIGTYYMYGGSHYQVARNGQIANVSRPPEAGEVRDSGGYETRVFNGYPVIIQRFEENA